jgi:cardiolipin synthase
MTVANLFTLLRIVLIPVFGVLWLKGLHTAALWTFAVAGVTDLLDGFLARYLDQRTRLGSFLDPAADKLMLLVSFLVAASLGAVPWWLAGLVIGRDLVLTAGVALLALVLRGRFARQRLRPTRIGKYSTFLQLATIALALLARAVDGRRDALRPWVAALVLVTCLLTVASALQYVVGAALALPGAWRGRSGFLDGAAPGRGTS